VDFQLLLACRCISAQVKFQLSRRYKLQIIGVKIIIQYLYAIFLCHILKNMHLDLDKPVTKVTSIVR
jgi:hypothetical protein